MVEFRTPEENYAKGIAPERIKAFDRGQLSHADMVILVQDIVEAGVLDKLPSKWVMRVIYYNQQLGWCYVAPDLKH